MRDHGKAQTLVRHESRPTLIRLALRVGQAGPFATPVGGFCVFARVFFTPAVTREALVVGLALVLRHAREPARGAFAVRETMRRHPDGHRAH